jgi:RNA-directed DNA polymerase
MPKRKGYLIEAIANPDNLRLAFWKAQRGKSRSMEVEEYRQNLDKHLLELRGEILSGQVRVGEYRYFKVYEPKERLISAATFHEKVLHHALMNICHPYFERCQINDSYASRKGKGTYAALDTSKEWTRTKKYYLKLDIRKFFESVEHGVLKEQLKRQFKDPVLLYIFDAIIDSYQATEGRGLPIGNLTSQYFANHYLCPLDHLIKDGMQTQGYVRYMDDMVLWHDDKAVLKEKLLKITKYVETELLCKLKPIVLNVTECGLSFLGYKLFKHYMQLTQGSKRRFRKKLLYLYENYDTLQWSESECQRRALPLLAFVQHASTKGLRAKIIGQLSLRS